MTPCTRATAALLAAVLITGPATADPIIWNGPSITFSKDAFVDPMAAENQDRITDNVWITRDNTRGLFNAKVETSQGNTSPAGTAWAIGTTDDLGSLTFGTWLDVFGLGGPINGPFNAVGQDFVLHLTAEDSYIDLRFDAWGVGSAAGGSFAYTRSTAIPEPTAIGLGCVLAVVSLCRPRKR